MFCVKCGTQYGIAGLQCPSCGSPLPLPDGTVDAAPVGEPVRESRPAPASSTSQPPPPIESPPYALFVSELLGSFLLFSAVVFNAGDALGRGRWNSTPSTVIATVGGCLLIRASWRKWGEIVAMEPETDLKFEFRHRAVFRTSLAVAAIFFAISGIVGWGIGRNGAEMTQLIRDGERASALGHRISEARTAADRTVPSHIAMYEKIEPDVQEWEAALGRLKNDWTVYDGKFPEQHQQTMGYLASIGIGLRRAALLKEQIAVAKAIKSLDEQQQWTVWQNHMQPLLAAEDALDNPK
jgi:hypothetical protein